MESVVTPDKKPQSFSCVVAGSGPSGLGLAAGLARRGVNVLVVSPGTKWVPTYGVWEDERALLPYEIPVERRWDTALVKIGEDFSRELFRGYDRVENGALSSAFFREISSSGAHVVSPVKGVFPGSSVFSVDFGDDLRATAPFFFDSTGHRPLFSSSPLGSPAFQTAFGIWVETASLPQTLSDTTMGFMLWDDGLEFKTPNGRCPAFFYAMPESDGTCFLELTVLAARPKTPVLEIEKRLRDWVRENEVKVVQSEREEERVFIPMGHQAPRPGGDVVPIGGAAAQVHPATGYMFVQSLRAAERVADVVAEMGGERKPGWQGALWDAVWPAADRQCHALHLLGLEALLAMRPEEVKAFFRAFFELPEASWRGYLSRTLEPGELQHVMWTLFRRVDLRMKARLAAAGVGRGTPHLFRGLFGG